MKRMKEWKGVERRRSLDSQDPWPPSRKPAHLKVGRKSAVDETEMVEKLVELGPEKGMLKELDPVHEEPEPF